MSSGRNGLAAADWAAVKDEIRTILISLARLRRTITYSDLAAQIRTAYVHHRAPAFHELLRQACQEEADAGRPSPCVLVVRKQTGLCGAGFFKYAAAAGADVSDPQAYWQREFEHVCAYWSEH